MIYENHSSFALKLDIRHISSHEVMYVFSSGTIKNSSSDNKKIGPKGSKDCQVISLILHVQTAFAVVENDTIDTSCSAEQRHML